MDAKGISYVILGSQRADVGSAMRPFSRLTRMDEQAARTLLTSHGPRLFRAYSRRPDAQGLANQLRSLGLAAAAIRFEDIANYCFLPSKQVNVGQGGISAFTAEGQAPTFIPFSDIAAMILGDVSEVIGREKVMAPSPGQPRVRTTYNKTPHLDIHRKSIPVAVRFRKADFHMNPIVAGEPLEGPTDLARFVSILKEKTPLAVFDDGFVRSGGAIEDSLRLIDAGEKAAIPPRSPDDDGPPQPPVLPPVTSARDPNELTELPAFDLYSTLWRYQLASD